MSSSPQENRNIKYIFGAHLATLMISVNKVKDKNCMTRTYKMNSS